MTSIIILALIAIISLLKDQYFSKKTPNYIFFILILLTIISTIFSLLTEVDEKDNQNYIKGGIDTVYVLNQKINSLTSKLNEATEIIAKKDERIDELELKTKDLEKKSNSIKTFQIIFSLKATTLNSHKVDNYTLTGEPLRIKLINDDMEEYIFETDRTFYLKRIQPNVIESSNKYTLENTSKLYGESLSKLKEFMFLEFYPNSYLNEASSQIFYINFDFIVNGKTLVTIKDLETTINATEKSRVDITKILNNSLTSL